MKFRMLAKVVLVSLLLVLGITKAHAQITDTWLFDTIPSNGEIAGSPGATIGWGYTITNESTDHWLFATVVQSDTAFEHGTASPTPFDFPVVAPGVTISTPYGAGLGLFDLIWYVDAPSGYVNSGNFLLQASWYDNDPFNGGQFLEDAGIKDASYSAQVAVTIVPEPNPAVAIGVLMASASLLLIRWRKLFC